MEKAKGFTQAQRLWFLARDENRCQYHFVGPDGKWKRCGNTRHLHVHHVVPRGWASRHYPSDFPMNGAYNGITLCEFHHVGNENATHPDTFEALLAYRAGDKKAFEKMMEKRAELCKKGIPYWNSDHDLMFVRIVQKANVSYLRTHPYPDKGKYGKTGRTKCGTGGSS